MRIRIDYLQKTREALLSTDETGRAWASIVRACQDHAQVDLIDVNEKEVKLPWWSFLLAKESIGYHVSRNGINVDFSDEAKSLLQEAVKKQDSYRKVSQ